MPQPDCPDALTPPAMNSSIRPLRRSLAPALLLVGALLAHSPAAAQAPGVLTVMDVPVDVTAEAADVARSQAHLQGQREAFARVV
ncbi:MAG: hypothetical protein WD270_02365, partial [Acetobacterales bacterium]